MAFIKPVNLNKSSPTQRETDCSLLGSRKASFLSTRKRLMADIAGAGAGMLETQFSSQYEADD